MQKIISTIICLTLIFGLGSLKTNKSDNRKYFKNLTINIEKNYLNNNNLPDDFQKKFLFDKLVFDLKENSESKTADNSNPQENEKEDSPYAFIGSLKTNIINFKLDNNNFTQDQHYSFNPSVPTSPPNC